MPTPPNTNKPCKDTFACKLNFTTIKRYYSLDENMNIASVVTSASAPLPYPMQPHGMPLPYTLPRTGPYPAYMCAPPMPTTYNPYATLHYQPQGKIKFS